MEMQSAFLRKYESRGNKIAQFASPNLSIYLILFGVGVLCDADIFKLTARAQSIYREVYAC